MAKFFYGLSKDEYGVHQKIIRKIKLGDRVLEIGCSSGYMTKELTGKGAIVVGVEANSSQAAPARKYCKQLIIGDIEENSTLKEVRGKFDIIILADVLEHLQDPEKTLRNLTKFLEPCGEVYISVPNIAFLTNRLLHLLGRFEYQDWGIMDRTHLKFFTKKSILNLIEEAGLELTQFDYAGNFTQLPLYMQTIYPIVRKLSWVRRLEYQITGLWPEGLAVQFLLVCRRGNDYESS